MENHIFIIIDRANVAKLLIMLLSLSNVKHFNMGSIRVCLRSLQPLFPWSHTAVFTRPLCTSDTNSRPCSRQTNKGKSSELTTGQSRAKNHLWDNVLEGREKRHYSPKSVFAAGTAKRIANMLKSKASVEEEEDALQPRFSRGTGKMQLPDRPLAATEWRKLKTSHANPQRFDIQMLSALFASKAELDIAKSLLTFVAKETGTLSYELLLRYLTLCVSGGHDDEVFDVYDIMCGSFTSLETGASSLFIKSFSRTARWREALSILQDIKKVLTPSPRNYGDVIAAAVDHDDRDTAWALYNELIGKGLSPHQKTWEVLFQGGRRPQKTKAEGRSAEAEQDSLLEILLYLRNNQIYPQHSLANCIKTWFESLPGQKWEGNWTSANPKGVCRCCGSQLESIQLTDEEYQELKDKVMADIIQGPDVFNKTTPEELERFKMFVKRKPTFDVVVDGLNVANINMDKSRQSDTLLAVLSELECQGLVVLVLGRKHMLYPSRSWNRMNMNLVQQKAHCFFTDNISEDDPFLLYAALHSGNHCRFVSQDLMRDHKACLLNGAAQRLFFKWQRGHQLVVDGYVPAGRKVRFQSIPSFDTIVQTSGNSWHIPYDDTEDRSTYEVPQRWLCLTRKQ
ncbi:mitochondrial ribonuclease P catalytic subunit [Gouania willdenowi]|uniref:Mitochondrial ribonuclease P catalytic subunit n=1 Tax=Gouania willdenowi TaxID=441366 RepID=A0A8C5GNI4_GOUWI|nr:mitochondrial ribonuclease P catalytic subunit [Gouania willdenowi]